MRITARPKHFPRPRLLFAFVLILGLLLPAIPARAIYGSDVLQPKTAYPYVGGIWLRWNCCLNGEAFEMPNPPGYPFFDEDDDGDFDPESLEGPKVGANGILIAPNVVLTQGVRSRNGRRVAVSFANPIGDIDPNDDSEFDVGAPGVYEGYIYHMPGLNREKSGYVAKDLAVVILDEDVDPDDYNGTLATLPGLNALNKLKGTELTAISYGPQNEAPYTPADEDAPTVEEILAPFIEWDFQRRESEWGVTNVLKTRLRLEAPFVSYYCDGDQGTPFIDDKTGDVAALMTQWSGYCNTEVAYGYRLDTKEVRDFLCDVGHDRLAAVPDPNNNVDGDFVLYDTPSTSLQSYCDDEQSARAFAAGDDGSKQSADRAVKAKHGGKHRGKGKRGR